jgi:hypothetical protein
VSCGKAQYVTKLNGMQVDSTTKDLADELCVARPCALRVDVCACE